MKTEKKTYICDTCEDHGTIESLSMNREIPPDYDECPDCDPCEECDGEGQYEATIGGGEDGPEQDVELHCSECKIRT